jgi:Peptidase family M1 domain
MECLNLRTVKKIILDNFSGKVILFLLFNVWFVNAADAQKYFQQEVNYSVQVTLNDKSHTLSAFETIQYVNNSPDTLRYLLFHLWPNAYSGNNTALARQLFNLHGKNKLFEDQQLKGYIDSLDFKIEGQKVQWSLLPGSADICRIDLNNPLCPGASIHISTPFYVKLPLSETSRFGHIGQSYQVSQWYPKPAVYDISGWHAMPYLDQGEFFSEFGNFEVHITLPDNYTVGATGDLQTSRELERLENLAADTSWLKEFYFGTPKFPASSQQFKTLKYTGKHIHDFAWFADKRFHVRKDNVTLPESGREVTTWIMFTDVQASLWLNAMPNVKDAITYFSNRIGDYPYNSFTVVQSSLTAGAGMEYPGLAVIGLANDAYELDGVLAHEIAHNWFYGALGFNERRYPYLDEGFTTAYETRYMTGKYPDKKLWEVYFKNRKLAKFLHIENMPLQRMQEIGWLIQARGNTEQPLNLASPDYSEENYNILIYYKSAQGYNYLRAYLGDSVFDPVMHDFYQEWKFRHPSPADIRSFFELRTGKNLDWFFDDFLKTTKRMDYKIIRYENNRLLVKNMGELNSPLLVSGMAGDTVLFSTWADGFEGKKWIELPVKNCVEIKIDAGHVTPELYRLNNNIRTRGIIRRSDPILTQLYFTMEDPDKRSLMYIPLVNWTRENGYMIGIALHNGFLIPKPVEYFFTPFYTFNKPGIAGSGHISYNIFPFNSTVRLIKFTIEGTQFGAPADQNYRVAKGSFNLFFSPKFANNPLLQSVSVNYIAATDLYQAELGEIAKMSSYLQGSYLVEKSRLVNPYQLQVMLEANKLYQKVSLIFNYRYSYRGKNNGLDIRFYTGTMLSNTSQVPFYGIAAGGRSGPEQYLYEGTYPDRFTPFPQTFLSRQVMFSEGSLVSPVNQSLGYSKQLVSFSIASSLPGKAGRIPIKPFINLLFNDHGLDTRHDSPVFFEAGLKAGLWNIFEIYVPLLVSANIQSVSNTLKDRIRITLNLDLSNQMKMKVGSVK